MTPDRIHLPAPANEAAGFEVHRRHLLAVAYRFLGSVADAEDVVQETYLRWIDSNPSEIKNARAYLSRIAARLCLDQLKSARVRREHYVGPWLPEPVVEASGFSTWPDGPDSADVSFALMFALERLSPLERAAFVLHDAFGLDFNEVGAALGRSPATCRQLANRARGHIRAARPRFTVAPGEGQKLADAFHAASQSGDIAGLTRLLATDAVLYSDSGGKVRAARRLILGRARIARLYAGLARRSRTARVAVPVRINGLPGYLMRDTTGVTQTLAFEIQNGLITALYLVRNPDKLRHVHAPVESGTTPSN